MGELGQHLSAVASEYRTMASSATTWLARMQFTKMADDYESDLARMSLGSAASPRDRR